MSYNITSTNTGIVLSNATTQNPATVTSFAYVTNTTANYSGDAIYGRTAAAWNITNYGTVKGTAGPSSGIDLKNGGTVTNASAAEIIGSATGVSITGATGTVSNSGTIEATVAGSTGVNLQAGGYVTNAGTGVISAGADGDAVVIAGTVGTVNNSGTLSGANLGAWLQAGGRLSNFGNIAATASYGDGVTFGNATVGSGTLSNFGTITAGNLGVWLEAGGVVTNTYARLISGGFDGVYVTGSAGAVYNSGTIADTGTSGSGVNLLAGGFVVNGSRGVDVGPALISGYDGVRISGASGTLTNYSTIASTGTGFGAQGVDFLAGGTLSNYGTILGVGKYASGVNAGYNNDTIINGSARYFRATIAGWLDGIDQFSSRGIVINFGTVESSNGNAVYLQAGGTVDNYGTAGLLAGLSDGVKVTGGLGTVINLATIVATSAGINLQAGGYVGNADSIVATGTAGYGVIIAGGSGTVVNSDYILAAQVGVRLGAGGTVNNSDSIVATGTLGYGVVIGGGTGTVVNSDLIQAAQVAVTLQSGGYVGNSDSIVATGTPGYGVVIGGGTGTVVNSDLIQAAQVAVTLQSGGYVGNSDSIVATGTAGDAIVISGGAGTVVNTFLIAGTNRGVYLEAGGTVINSGTIAGTASFGDGIVIGSAAVGSGTLINSGTITGGNLGVWLDAGGVLTNTSTGLIFGGYDGVLVSSSAGTVVNLGTIDPSTNYGVNLQAGGQVTNAGTGLITGYAAGVRIVGSTGSLTNSGSITATGTNNARGIGFFAGGLVSNSGTVSALGGTLGTGVYLASGGTLSNAAGAVISGSDNGVEGRGSVFNAGTIAGSGFAGAASHYGRFAYNSAGGVIEGPRFGVDIGALGEVGYVAATVINHGSIAATGTYFPTGLYLGGGGSVDNFGTVSATGSTSGIGVNFAHGGTLTNESGALITASADGVVISGTYGSLNNLGTIIGVNDGVVLKATGANLTNSGLISDGDIAGFGLYLYAGGNATNAASGVIQGYHGILSTRTAANVVNLGTIASLDAADGVRFNVAGSTLTNAGTIAANGGYGVRFTGAGNRLTIDPGAVFSGARAAFGGGGGNDVLELAAGTTGTLGGSQYTGFDVTQIDAGANWAVAGVDTIPAGGTLLDFGTLTNLGTLLGTGAQLIVDPGTFINSGYVNTTVTLAGGSYLDNTSTGTISVAGTAVLGLNSPNTVVNAGTIVGSGSGIYLSTGGYVGNSSTGTIQGYTFGIKITGAIGTIVNDGQVRASGANSGAIAIEGAGSVDNAASGLIAGNNDGIRGYSASDTVTNLGTITAGERGVVLFSGGTVVNGASNVTSALISATPSASTNGVDTGYGSAFVLNYGTLTGRFGVFGRSPVTVSNNGLISGRRGGVYLAGSAATVTNTATISAYGGPGYGVLLTLGGTVINSGLITGTFDGVRFGGAGVYGAARGGAGTVFNTGSIVGTSGAGVGLDFGGLVTNGTAGVIGGYINGVVIRGGYGSISNLGTISAGTTYGAGAYLAAGGSITNGSALATGALIVGNDNALSIFNAVGSVTNFGTLAAVGSAGYGAVLSNGGTITNSGTILETGTSGTAVRLGNGGILTNNSGGLIAGGGGGVYVFGAAGTVSNSGTIASNSPGSHDGVYVGGGGIVTNTVSGLIKGRDGVDLRIGGTVSNTGTIIGYGSGNVGGVFLGFTYSPGAFLVTNSGLITSAASGVLMRGDGSIDNSGTILGTGGSGIFIAGGAVTNTGTIAGGAGVAMSGAGTIANFGTIVGTGGTAISLGGGADLVILEPGSTLSGAIAGFVPGDTLDLVAVPFSPSDTVTFDGTILTVSGGGVSESVALAGIAAGTDFILESDAQGDAQIGPVSSGSNLVVSSGQILTVLAGQNVSNVTVESGGVLDVASGGVASGATIEAGGVETVFTGGTDSGATVSSGGFEDVFGSATATLVLNGGSQTVEAGGSVTGAVLDGAGLQTVAGFAGGTVVGSGDEELVTSGGVASGSVISSGGSEIVLSGGLASDTTIAGGTLELEAGAMASGLISFAGSGGVLQLDSLTMPEAAVAGLLTGDVIDFRALPFAGGDTVAFDGTILTVSGGGVSESVRMTGLGASSVFLLRSDGNGGTDAGLVPASGAVVSAGEVLHISAGETLSDVTVLSGGILEVDAGGTALGTMVSSGGEELVLSGGTDSGAVISGGGFEDVFGNASATLVLNGGSQTVEAGGSVTGAVLDGVGLQTVSGVAIGTVVSGGDEQLVLSGGVAIGTTVLSGGLLVVASGGVASGAVIANGGEAVVSAGGVDRGAMTSGGGVEEVFGSAGGTVVLSGGEQLVEPGGSASGTVISQGGLEQVLGGVTSDTRIAGGKLEVTTGAAAAGVIGFGGVVGTLRLDSLATPAATLGGVVAGDVIDLPLLSFATSDTATLGQNDLLTVSGGGESVSLQFDASVAGKGFALSDDGSGGVLLTLTPQVPQASLFDFVFVYNGGQDYYLGRVADDGRFGYTVGETKTNAAGSYIIFGEESGATSAAAGSVFVDYYSHGGPGAASGIPVKTAAGNADGNAGLGSESDTLLGLDGAGHAFSSTQPAVFATTALYGFVFTYANGAAYTGTVADNTPGGLPGSRTVRDGSGNLLGVYTTFREGVTSRAAGSVVIDRFVANGIAVLANHASSTAVDGRSGLGSEVGSVTVGSVNHAFGPRAEPVVTGNAPTEPAASTPPVSDVIANEVDRIFVDILGRFPSQSEFDATGGELGQGTSTGDVRAALASGSEASGDVTGLYGQVFGRAATTGEISGASGMLADGGSLASLQQQLANSSEAAGDINQVYRDILGHDADPSGLASFVAALGDETPGHLTDPGGLAGLAGVRDVLAHSGQAQDALTSLFDGIIGRAPSNAELVGMEDRLVTAGTTEATLRNALSATGSAGGFTTIAAPGGTASLSAPSGPSLFQFSDVAFNDTITGFNAGRDTIQLPKTVAADFATVEADTTGASGGSLITLNQNQSIFLASLPPAKLAAGNFLLL